MEVIILQKIFFLQLEGLFNADLKLEGRKNKKSLT